jgi:hypothetical protein
VSHISKETGYVGLVNGVAQCLACSARAVGPALGGTLWSWSLLNGLPFPLDYHFIFLFLASLSVLAFLQARFISL